MTIIQFLGIQCTLHFHTDHYKFTHLHHLSSLGSIQSVFLSHVTQNGTFYISHPVLISTAVVWNMDKTMKSHFNVIIFNWETKGPCWGLGPRITWLYTVNADVLPLELTGPTRYCFTHIRKRKIVLLLDIFFNNIDIIEITHATDTTP